MSFKDYILNVHPDPDFLGSKTVYDAYDELDRLAQNYAKDQNERLTKEVEELKNDLLDALDLKNGNGPTALTMLSNELTRLRELLGRASQYIQVYGMGGDTAKQLLTDIDNGLNPKP